MFTPSDLKYVNCPNICGFTYTPTPPHPLTQCMQTCWVHSHQHTYERNPIHIKLSINTQARILSSEPKSTAVKIFYDVRSGLKAGREMVQILTILYR